MVKHNLEKAVALSTTILEQLKSESWDALIETTQLRQRLLEDYFSQHTVTAAESEQVKAAIESIQALDREAKQIIEQSRRKSIDGMLAINKSFKALKAYESSSVE